MSENDGAEYLRVSKENKGRDEKRGRTWLLWACHSAGRSRHNGKWPACNGMGCKTAFVHPGPYFTNDIFNCYEFLIGDPEFSSQSNDGLLGSKELVLFPCAVLHVDVTNRMRVAQQVLTGLCRDLWVTCNIVRLLEINI